MTVSNDAMLALGRKFMESRVFLTASELDLFTLLENNSLSAVEIAGRLRVTLRGITILLDAAVSMELLEKNDGLYNCPPAVASILSKNSGTSIIPMVMHSVELWKRWSNLTDIVRNGIEKSRPAASDSGEKEREAFIGAMHVVSSKIAPGIVAAVKPEESRRLLDIGCASGSYSEEFLKSSQAMTATLFDLPPVIRIAERRLSGTGLLDRITLVPGDFYKDELPAGHDLALLSAIIHQNSPEQNLDLYRKIFNALLPGGRLVIRDHIMSSDHVTPSGGALFAVNMLVGTPGGSTYSFEEIKSSLESVGFIKIALLQQGERMDGLVEGFKP